MKTILLLGICLVFLIGFSNVYAAQIPTWVKNNAKWWSQNQITDDEFVKGIQYLIDNQIIQIPETTQVSGSNSAIPSWVKNTAGWWAAGTLNDSDFIQGIQYLVKENIIKIKQDQFVLTSPVFGNNSTIPVEYTCDGKGISPPLAISGVPKNTTSMVLVVDDPDAPRGTFVHWTMFNISANTTQFAKAYTLSPQGLNGANKLGYFGPCPPSGNHHYFFKLYALDTTLVFNDPPTKSDLEKAMTGHVLEKTTLLGRYSRG